MFAGTSSAVTGASSTWKLGGDLPVNRLGFGAMRLTGEGIWGWPADRDSALKVLHRAVELGVNLIDTADAYGPEVSELLIAEALYPYPKGLVIATKGGNTRPGPGQWVPNGRPEYLKGCVDKSLKRLRLDRIDGHSKFRSGGRPGFDGGLSRRGAHEPSVPRLRIGLPAHQAAQFDLHARTRRDRGQARKEALV